jgi:hypothetical protein
MRLDIETIANSTTDTKGAFSLVGVTTLAKEQHTLVMPLAAASKLIAMICHSGLLAEAARPSPAGQLETVDSPVTATAIAAGMGPDNSVHLVLRFGRVSISTQLTASDALSLAEGLRAVAGAAPARTQ